MLGHPNLTGKALVIRIVSFGQQPLLSNAGYLILVNLVNSIGGYLFWMLAAAIYLPSEVGIASAIVAAAGLVATVANFGLDASLVRFLPEAQAPTRFVNTVITFSLIIALLIGALFVVGVPFWFPSLGPLRQNGWHFLGFLLYAAFFRLATVSRMVFVASRKAVFIPITALLVIALRAVLATFLARLGALGLTAAMALAVAVGVVVSLFVILPKVVNGFTPRLVFGRHELKGTSTYSAGSYAAAMVDRAAHLLLPLFILDTLGPESAGYAAIALLIGEMAASPGTALAGSAFAEASHFPGRLNRIVGRTLIVGLVLTAAVAVTILPLAPQLLSVFGPEYAPEATVLLRWLAIAAPATVFTRMAFTWLRVQKRVRLLFALNLILSAAMLSTTLLLLGRMGISAAGIAWLIGYALVSLIIVGKSVHSSMADIRAVVTEQKSFWSISGQTQ